MLPERTPPVQTTSNGNGAVRLVPETIERAWNTLRSMSRSRAYPVLGVILALAAPIGLVFARAVAAEQVPTLAWVLADVGHLPVTYAYVTLSTVAVFAVLGFVLGGWFDRVRLLSITDPLTGLFNRRHFGQRLAEETRRAHRHGHPTCILCVDIDRLKAINDGFGHQAGDHALVTVSRTLLKTARAIDAVARVGGDEFAVLLPETSAVQASAFSRRILMEVAQLGDTVTGKLAVSIGIAELSAMADAHSEDLLAAADAALYRAKAAGGGQAAIAPPEPVVSPSCHFTLMEAALLIENDKRIGASR